jgi:hypothetical protein
VQLQYGNVEVAQCKAQLEEEGWVLSRDGELQQCGGGGRVVLMPDSEADAKKNRGERRRGTTERRGILL